MGLSRQHPRKGACLVGPKYVVARRRDVTHDADAVVAPGAAPRIAHRKPHLFDRAEALQRALWVIEYLITI